MRVRMEQTRMELNSKFSVCFLDFNLCCGGRDPKGIVVCGIDDHGVLWVSAQELGNASAANHALLGGGREGGSWW